MGDPLDYIDGCTEGTECPDAGLCREHKPEWCPLADPDFMLDPETTLDKVIKDAY